MNEKDFTIPIIEIEKYPRGWKLLSLHLADRPKNIGEWKNFLWGFDLWYGSIPLGKGIVVANLIMWVLMWVILL